MLTDPDQERKVMVTARELQPMVTILDPAFVSELPFVLAADTGLDVVSHAVEAFTCSWHNDFSDAMAVRALQLVFAHLGQSCGESGDMEARERMHNAATMAGLAISNASIALGHALAHSFGAVFHVPHGRAVGMLLPYSMEYTANGGGTRYAELANLLSLGAEDEAEGVRLLVQAIRDLARSVGRPLRVRDLGIDREQYTAVLDDLVAKAAADHALLTTVRMPEDDEMRRLFEYAYDGRQVDF
jgi:alcohol dehydrogenase class IV